MTALTDHLIEHNFQLIDHDGKVTRWGNFSPESLNYDFRWFAERGLNSMSMLAYLAIAEHMVPEGSMVNSPPCFVEIIPTRPTSWSRRSNEASDQEIKAMMKWPL